MAKTRGKWVETYGGQWERTAGPYTLVVKRMDPERFAWLIRNDWNVYLAINDAVSKRAAQQHANRAADAIFAGLLAPHEHHQTIAESKPLCVSTATRGRSLNTDG
jgi:hypothetical protein